MQVYALIVLLRHIARYESVSFQRIFLHDAHFDGLLYLVIEFLHATDAALFALFATPNGKRCAPETRTRQVPVVQIVKPVAKPTRAGRLGLPVNGLVQLRHTLLHGRALDEPRVERIVEHRLVCTPAMRVIVDVLFNLEHFVLLFEVHAYADVQCLVLVCQRLVVGILHIATGELAPLCHVDIVLDELFVKILHQKVFALQVDHGAFVALLVNQHNRRYAGLFGHKGVVGTKVWCNMHNTGTILSGHVVTGNDPERSVLHRTDHGQQLLIGHADQVRSLIVGYNLPWNHFLSGFVTGQIAVASFFLEIGCHTGFGQHNGDWFGAVRVERLDGYIVNFRSYAERRVGSKRPRRRRPGHKIRCAEGRHLRLRVRHTEKSGTGSILHVAVASGLIQLMARQARACGG